MAVSHVSPSTNEKPVRSWSGMITLGAATLGILVGLYGPQISAWIPAWIGDLFIRLLKLVAPPLVLLSCMRAIISLGDMQRVRKIGSRAALYYLSTSMLAALVGTLMSWIMIGQAQYQPLNPVSQAPPFEGGRFIEKLVPKDLISPFLQGEILQLITLAIVISLLILRRPQDERRHWDGWVNRFDALINDAAQAVLWLTPLAAFCIIAKLIPSLKWSELAPFKSFLWAWGIASLVHALITLPLILWVFTKRSPLRFFLAVRDALLVALTTASSAGTLPVSKRVLETQAEVSSESTSFILPLGATLNMDGSAVYQAQLLLFMCVAEGRSLSLSLAATVIALVLFSSAGTSAIPRGGIAMMGMMILFLDLPIAYLTLYIVVDQVLDYPITALNVWGDLIGTKVIDEQLSQTTVTQENMIEEEIEE